VIRGKILTYHRRSGIRNTDNEQLETGIYISAEAQLHDRATGRVVSGPVGADAAVGYILGPVENEREARERALRRIAEELVLDLLRPLD
jgi:hypothetical protein